MNKVDFYICRICGNIVAKVYDSGVPLVCCGDEMELLEANSTDGAAEKHVPVIEVDGDVVTVTVGGTLHPMEAAHYIEWIYIQTENGGQRKVLKPGDKPAAKFVLTDDKLVAAYAYCNLHGLWVAKA